MDEYKKDKQTNNNRNENHHTKQKTEQYKPHSNFE